MIPSTPGEKAACQIYRDLRSATYPSERGYLDLSKLNIPCPSWIDVVQSEYTKMWQCNGVAGMDNLHSAVPNRVSAVSLALVWL
jgi:hypothetical protein